MGTILEIVKARLGRMDTALDVYLQELITAAIGRLRNAGIHVQPTAEDHVLVADYAVWMYQNRDQKDGMPEWLKVERRERWLQDPAMRRNGGNG